MKVSRICFLLVLAVTILASPIKAKSNIKSWEGSWIYVVDSEAIGGELIIKNCSDNTCGFSIETNYGAHLCGIEGKIKIESERAYSFKFDIDDAEIADCKIKFLKDRDGKNIEISYDGNCRYFCGARGYFDGTYRNGTIPKTYKTSFECKKAGNQTEKILCTNELPAKADLELAKVYEKTVKGFPDEKPAQKNWIKKRDECKGDVDCLVKMHEKRIKELSGKLNMNQFSLFSFLRMNYPDDAVMNSFLFSLILQTKMKKEHFETFRRSMQISSDDGKSESEIHAFWGVAGLFTIAEASYTITNKDKIWVAFLSTDDSGIMIYHNKNAKIGEMPISMRKWIGRFEDRDEGESADPNNILVKYKNFPVF